MPRKSNLQIPRRILARNDSPLLASGQQNVPLRWLFAGGGQANAQRKHRSKIRGKSRYLTAIPATFVRRPLAAAPRAGLPSSSGQAG
jgi:hypothetical protein